jgi:hypothetical protein
MKTFLKRLNKQNRWIAATCAALVLAGGAGVYLRRESSSPAGVRRRVVEKLEGMNAKALCALADPEEVEKLHLTPEAVNAVLRETLWSAGKPDATTVKQDDVSPLDQSLWTVQFPQAASPRPYVTVVLIDHQQIGWKVNLSALLRSTCFWKYGKDGPRRYRELARQYGIRGIRQQDGAYTTLAEMEARALAMERGLRDQQR